MTDEERAWLSEARERDGQMCYPLPGDPMTTVDAEILRSEFPRALDLIEEQEREIERLTRHSFCLAGELDVALKEKRDLAREVERLNGLLSPGVEIEFPGPKVTEAGTGRVVGTVEAGPFVYDTEGEG